MIATFGAVINKKLRGWTQRSASLVFAGGGRAGKILKNYFIDDIFLRC
jgi:hypothetical protein